MSYFAADSRYLWQQRMVGFIAGMIVAGLLLAGVAISSIRVHRAELATAKAELHRVHAEKCPTPLTIHERVMKWIERDGQVKCQRFWAASVLEAPQ